VVLCPTPLPVCLARQHLSLQPQWHRTARNHPERLGDSRPDILPTVDVAVGDIERLVAGNGRLAGPGNAPRQQIGIDRLADPRRTAGIVERLAGSPLAL